MTRFTCRGFEGRARQHYADLWTVSVRVTDDVTLSASGQTAAAAKSRVRRKLDAVERAFRQRGGR